MSGQLGTIPYPLMGQWQDAPGTVWQPGTYPLPPPDISPLYAPPAMPLVEQPVPVYGPDVRVPPQDTPASWQQQPVYQPPAADALPLPPIPPGTAPAPLVQGSPGVPAHDPSQNPYVMIGPDGKPVLQTTATGTPPPKQQPQQQQQQPAQQPAAAPTTVGGLPTLQAMALAAAGRPQQALPIAPYTPTPIAQVTPPVPAVAIPSAVGHPIMFAPPIGSQMGGSYGSDEEHERTANRYRNMLS